MSGSGIGRAARVGLLLVSAWLSIGWGGNWEELKSAAGGVKSVRAEFVQEKHMKILARPLISSGVFYYQAPAALRWEYRSPLRTILLMDAERTERWVETAGRLTKEDGVNLQAMQVVLEQISQWLDGRFDENPMFSARLDPGPVIVMTPREQGFAKMIQRIEVRLSVRPGVIDTVTIHEADASFTRLAFNNVVLNSPIDKSLFRHVP
jgi:hypothetical protein